jgi:hypothetical protein
MQKELSQEAKALILAAAIILVFLFNKSCDDSKSNRKENECSTAFVMSQEFVKRRLKSPSTAKFNYEPEKCVDVNGIHKVHAYVDAQNVYGTLIRYNYGCELKKEGDDWKCIYLIIDGEEYIK